jgi:DNA repair protein RadC
VQLSGAAGVKKGMDKPDPNAARATTSGPAATLAVAHLPSGPSATGLVSLLTQVLGGRWPVAGACPRSEELPLLSHLEPGELARRLDLSAVGGIRLAAAFELGRRVEQARIGPRPSLDTPERANAVFMPHLRGQRREALWAALLDGRHRLLKLERISEGTLTTSLVHPREVFARALAAPAAALIVAHNHPSGDPAPSPEDREVTRRLHAAGELLGIPLLDHLVVSDGGFVSIRERFGLT